MLRTIDRATISRMTDPEPDLCRACMSNLGTSIARAAVLAVTALELPRVSADDHRMATTLTMGAMGPGGRNACHRADLLNDAARAADRVISDCIARSPGPARTPASVL